MIIIIALILLYLVLGAWLFVGVVTSLGGLANIPEYENKFVRTLSFLIVMIFWPVFVLHGIFRRRR